MPHSLFISDLHLSAAHARSMSAFETFITTQAMRAEALYILGDLFEYWAGDDDLNDPFHKRVTDALSSLSSTRVYLMCGNRDLLIGQELAGACNAVLLEDPALIDLYGTPTLLSHGDMLCTDDAEYQKFRKTVRSPDFKHEFLSRPLSERKAWIRQLRERSIEEKLGKDSAIMDVNEEAVSALLREYRYARLIHGHTHRPDRHVHMVDGHRCERWVLGDWDDGANALRADADGITRI